MMASGDAPIHVYDDGVRVFDDYLLDMGHRRPPAKSPHDPSTPDRRDGILSARASAN